MPHTASTKTEVIRRVLRAHGVHRLYTNKYKTGYSVKCYSSEVHDAAIRDVLAVADIYKIPLHIRYRSYQTEKSSCIIRILTTDNSI